MMIKQKEEKGTGGLTLSVPPSSSVLLYTSLALTKKNLKTKNAKKEWDWQ